MIRSASLLALSFAAALASAATPVGTWTGKFLMKMPPMPANAPAAQKEMVTKAMAQMKTAKIVLVLKADKTYTGKTIGLPGAQPDAGGTWSQAGNVVTIQPKRAGSPPRKLEMSKDGKTMTISLPGGQGKIVFTR